MSGVFLLKNNMFFARRVCSPGFLCDGTCQDSGRVCRLGATPASVRVGESWLATFRDSNVSLEKAD